MFFYPFVRRPCHYEISIRDRMNFAYYHRTFASANTFFLALLPDFFKFSVHNFYHLFATGFLFSHNFALASAHILSLHSFEVA